MRAATEADLSERPATRLYLTAELAAGMAVELDPAPAHRLRNVLRLGPGDPVAAFNEATGEWLCRLGAAGRGRAVLEVDRQLRPCDAGTDLWLVFAPVKRARLDWLIEKATELGVGALVPVMTERTQPDRLNRERLTAIAIAAAEQCERLSVPRILAPERLVSKLAAWPAARPLIVCDESGGGVPIAMALQGFAPAHPAAVMVGPEGGFTEAELDALGKLPIVKRIGLGPRALRAETAAIAALAVFQAISGDGRRIRHR